MALRDQVAEQPEVRKPHAVDRLMAKLTTEDQEELLDCLNDLNVPSGTLSKAIKNEWNEHLVPERIRDWRRRNVTE